MTSVEDLLVPQAHRAYCAELERLQKNLLEQQARYNASKDRVFLAAYLLANQCQDFGEGLRLLPTSTTLASSSQQTLLRSLLEAALRLIFVDQLGEEGLNKLWRVDLDERDKRLKVAIEVWADYSEEVAIWGPVTWDGEDAISELERLGFKKPRDGLGVEKLITECKDKVKPNQAKKIYSLYKELCPAAHSELGYLTQRCHLGVNASQLAKAKCFELASLLVEAVNASLMNIYSRELASS
jgi:hypothetical protein